MVIFWKRRSQVPTTPIECIKELGRLWSQTEEGFHLAKSKETQALPSVWVLWHKEKRRKQKGDLLYVLEVFCLSVCLFVCFSCMGSSH